MMINTDSLQRRLRFFRRRRYLWLLLAPLLVVAAILVYLYLKIPTCVLAENRQFPLGATVTLADVVLEVRDGTLINGDQTFYAVPGEQIARARLKNSVGRIVEVPVSVSFGDDTAPEISGVSNRVTQLGVKIDLLAGVSASDESGECTLKVLGEYDFEVGGEYQLAVTAADAAGNTATRSFTLTVEYNLYDENGDLIDGKYRTSTGRLLEVKDGVARVDGVLIVNKSFSLPQDYSQRNLTKETQAAYDQMAADAARSGLKLTIASAVRSYADQRYLYNKYVAQSGKDQADLYSARPGHSEHQTGLAVDLVCGNLQEVNWPGNKEALAWLAEHAAEYGFILRYPENAEELTGYNHEPWHFRYVGTALAKTLYNNGDWITLEEYFGVDSVYH